MATKATAGTWAERDAPIYFRASLLDHLKRMSILGIRSDLLEPTILVAMSSGSWAGREINVDSDEDLLFFSELTRTHKVLLDSGAFGLAVRHATNHGISLEDALRAPVADIDGYDLMLDNWRKVVRTCGDRLWGYIELDLGGREQKKKLRAELESEGFSPIPVFHALTDGWDYFDELASSYDRICVGNLAQANRQQKIDILYMLNHRRQGTALRWVHCLGVTPSPFFVSMPTESCDSTSYYSDMMYGGTSRSIDGFLSLDTDLSYVRKDSDARVSESLPVYYQRIHALEVMASCVSRATRHHLGATGGRYVVE